MEKPFVVDLSACRTVEHLAAAFGIHADVLAALASPEAANYYRRHAIPKRSGHRRGEVREVFEPATEELRQVHKTINRRLSAYASHRDPAFPPGCCYGFVRKRSTLENADQHKGRVLLQRIDIADFFPSISRGRVADVLTSIGLTRECAQLLSHALCFNGALVPGLSASPLVANLACRELDARMLRLAGATSSIYTRYADDMAFSGDSVPRLSDVAQALEAEGFAIATGKHRLTKRGQAHFVTGLSIQDPERPHVPKKMKRTLRQELYYSGKHSIQDHLVRRGGKRIGEGVNRLDGMVRYVSYIERSTAYDFRAKWERLQARDDVSPTVSSDYGKEERTYFVVVDETIIKTPSRQVMAVGFVLYEDEVAVNAAVSETRDAYMADPFVPGRKRAVARNGLHYVESHQQLKAAFIARLPTVPFRTIVGITELATDTDEGKAEAYLRAFRWGLSNVCGRVDRGRLTLRIEEPSFIARAAVLNALARGYELMRAAGLRRPATQPELVFVGKQVPAVAIPDFMLGVLGGYVKSSEPSADADKAVIARGYFERVRDRFTLIHDLETGHYFSRRKPFLVHSLDDRSEAVVSSTNSTDAGARPEAETPRE